MSVELLAEARLEMIEAAKFYDARQDGLGDQFLDAVERAVADIGWNPRRWPLISRGLRKRAVGRFPYALLYRPSGGGDDGEILIIAVMHMHRRPHYWTDRLNP